MKDDELILWLSCPIASLTLGYGLGRLLCYIDQQISVLMKQGTNDDYDDDEENMVMETRDASPAHFLTKIESFSLFSDYGIDSYETTEFEAGGYKWRLKIHPVDKEKEKEKGDHISVYLSMVGTSSFPNDWELHAIFTIFLYNQISDKYHCFPVKQGRRFNGTKSEWGFPKFISKKRLYDKSSGYLVGDNLVLGAEVFVLKKQQVVERVTLLKPSKYLGDWKIPEFSKLKNIWTSEEFLTSGFNWKIKLYPNGDFTSKNNEVKICLVCVSVDAFAAHQKVKAKFYVRLIGRSDVVIRECELSHWFTLSDTTWGCSFKTLAEKDFLIDDCCTLQVEIHVQIVV